MFTLIYFAFAAPSYADGLEAAIREVKPLVVFVGRPSHQVPGALVAACKSLDGYPDGCAVLCEPFQGRMVWKATIEQPTKDNVAAAVNRFTKQDALDEVNAKRSRAGLKPFVRDDGLTKAAAACAAIRAENGIRGHLPSDFAYLPSGASADAAGCGALDPSWEWQSCCDDEDYTYAGAAVVIGADGKRYMLLFVRR
jgi:hypothetical protein